MSTSFDYISAWCDVARPAYDTLPADLRQLFLDTARIAADCRQDDTCAMIWPTDEQVEESSTAAFRGRFEKIPAEWLAFGAHVINALGHWMPGDRALPPELVLPAAERAACKAGAHWKFSHYADQVLRVKLGLPERDRLSASGVSFAVHEGAIRVCYYSSRHMWCWEEVAPATAGGMEIARKYAGQINTAIGAFPVRHGHKRDNAAYAVIEQIRTTDRREEWPAEWRPFVNVGARYMTDHELHGRPEVRTRQLHEKAARLPAEYEKAISVHAEKKRAELAGRVWWLSRGIDDDNLIYYDHTRRFCFGWREPIGAEFLARILEHASEFPYLYEIKVAKCAQYPNGTVLRNEE